MKKTLMVLALGSVALTSYAEDANKITKDIELGVISTSGNTKSTSLKGRFNMIHDLEKSKNEFVLDGFYKEDQVIIEENGVERTEDQTTADKFFISNQYDYKFGNEHQSFFGFGSYEQDDFSGFEYQGTLAVGYSDRLFNFDRSHLDYSVGPGVAFLKTEDTTVNGVAIDGETEENFIIRAALSYLYQISDNAKFTQKISSDIATDLKTNTKTKAESALTVNMNSSLALKASFVLDQNTHPAPGRKHADTQTAITIVYSL